MSSCSMASRWCQVTLESIQDTKTSSPLSARALAMVHTAMFDAWSVYDRSAISTSTKQYIKVHEKHCTRENRRKAFSYAAFRVLHGLFHCRLPIEKKEIFRELMCEYGYNPDDTTIDCVSPQGIGNLVGRYVLESRQGDGANSGGSLHWPNWSDYTCYQPVNTWDNVNDVGHWQPLRLGKEPEWKIQRFLAPHWGLVQPFALRDAAEFRPGPPARKHSPEFDGQAAELLLISECLNDKQKMIAEYWSDNPGTYTAPGHWFEIARFIVGRYGYGNSDCIRLFFALGNAMLDTAIAVWECKHFYDYVRPISAIRELYRGRSIKAWGGPGKGTVTMNGEDWIPYRRTEFLSPPHAEHVSCHSAFAGAAATILKNYTGSDSFGGCTEVEKGSSQIEPGLTPATALSLDWPTFSEAADEAGLSCLYAGIHFQNSNQHGLKLGKAVSQSVWQKAKFYFNT